jgi:FMN phosphatase YigB (HAD superfamily)
MKKIIFFDGDGTLWAPKHPKYEEPWHIYIDQDADPFSECQPEPGALETLEAIGELGIKRILLSTSPLPPEQAMMNRIRMVKSMGLEGLLDEIHFSPNYPEGKSEKIMELLDSHDIAKQCALMIGDMYKWDYKPAQDVGVDALLIERTYSYKYFEKYPGTRVIKHLNEILEFIS